MLAKYGSMKLVSNVSYRSIKVLELSYDQYFRSIGISLIFTDKVERLITFVATDIISALYLDVCDPDICIF